MRNVSTQAVLENERRESKRETPKSAERVTVPRDVEIEKIKRQLHHLIDRVDALKTK